MPKIKHSAPKSTRKAALLGPGLHLVEVDLGTEGETYLRSADGRRLRASLSASLDPALVDECRRGKRPMLAHDTTLGPTLVGALQTAPALERARDGSVTIAGTVVHIEAAQRVELTAGEQTALRLESSGKSRLRGDKLTIDVGTHMRVLSARVELP